MQLEEIKKLANLARINMSEEEMIAMASDFDAILDYVNQIGEARELILRDSAREDDKKYSYFMFENVTREDISTENPGEKADKIINEMPDEEGRFLKVKQIL